MTSTGMKKSLFSIIFKKYNSVNLVLRIIIGIFLGIIFAIYFPNFKFLKMFGELFIGALKGIAPVLVFVLIIGSLVNGQIKQDGRFKVIVLLYMLSTFLASCIAVVLSFIFPLTLTLASLNEIPAVSPGNMAGILHNLLVNIV